MTLQDFKKNEMNQLYLALAKNNVQYEEEIISAIKQKNTLNQHIFDVLATRGMISYGEIAVAVKEILKKIGSTPTPVFLDKTSGDVLVSEDGFYIKGDDNTDIPVDVKFMVGYDDLIDEYAKPIVVVPKDIYSGLVIKRQHKIKGENDMNFTMNDIVKEAISKGTSDIHFKYGVDIYTVSFRIHGALEIQERFTMNMEKADDFFNVIRQKMALDTKTGFKSTEYNLPQGGTLKYDDLGVDLRGQFTPSGKSDKNNLFVCRIIKKNVGKIMTLDDLQGYDENFIELLRRATHYTKGFILVTGVTNSGKSTLTSSFINSIPMKRSIATAEDPIEYPKNRRNTTQHQVFLSDDKSISVDFLSLVKSWKRSDQDVTEIGEIRKDDGGKNELMSAVVEGVKAGNLTVSTTHIDSCYDVPLSLVNIYDVDRYIVAELLVFVITQVLVEKLCPHCRMDDTELENNIVLQDWLDRGDVKSGWQKDLKDFLNEKTVSKKRNPNGCPHCNYTGIEGLTPIYEYYKPDVEMISWLNQHLDTINRFDIEKEFCSKENRFLARNKISCYVDKLRAGEVDAGIEVITRVLQ